MGPYDGSKCGWREMSFPHRVRNVAITAMTCIFVSEIAALTGRNPYKTADDSMIAAMNRNGLNHPSGRSHKQEAANIKALVDDVEQATVRLIEKTALTHKTDPLLLAAVIKDPSAEASPLLKAVAEEVKQAVKTGALQEAIVTHNVPKAVAVKAVQSSVACAHGIEKEDSTRQNYNKRHGTASFEQQAVKETFITPEGHKYVLYGRLDGYDTDKECVVEYKNRTRRFFRRVPDYEMPQLYAYMALTTTTHAMQIEQFQGDTLAHSVDFSETEWMKIRTELDTVVDEMYRIHSMHSQAPARNSARAALDTSTRMLLTPPRAAPSWHTGASNITE